MSVTGKWSWPVHYTENLICGFFQEENEKEKQQIVQNYISDKWCKMVFKNVYSHYNYKNAVY